MEFLKPLTFAAAFLSLALLFLPEKEGIRRAATLLFSLLFLLLLLPRDGSFSVSDLLPNVKENAIAEESETYSALLADSVREGIRLDLSGRFALDSEELTLETDISLTEKGISGTYLRLLLGKANFFADATSIIRYAENTYSVICEVSYVGN